MSNNAWIAQWAPPEPDLPSEIRTIRGWNSQQHVNKNWRPDGDDSWCNLIIDSDASDDDFSAAVDDDGDGDGDGDDDDDDDGWMAALCIT